MEHPEKRRIPVAEWIAGMAGLLIVLGTLGYLAFQALQPPPGGPALTVSVVRVRQVDRTFVVEIEIRNASRAVAADVHIAGAARSADGREARPQARVDYVPGFSTQYAALVFEIDPGEHPDVRVIGYAKP